MGKKREEKRRKRKREIIKKAVFDKRAEKIWWVDGWEPKLVCGTAKHSPKAIPYML